MNVLRDGNGEATVGVFNADTIQEVQILTSTMPAEYGRAKDGQVRFVTKSGRYRSLESPIIKMRAGFAR